MRACHDRAGPTPRKGFGDYPNVTKFYPLTIHFAADYHRNPLSAQKEFEHLFQQKDYRWLAIARYSAPMNYHPHPGYQHRPLTRVLHLNQANRGHCRLRYSPSAAVAVGSSLRASGGAVAERVTAAVWLLSMPTCYLAALFHRFGTFKMDVLAFG